MSLLISLHHHGMLLCLVLVALRLAVAQQPVPPPSSEEIQNYFRLNPSGAVLGIMIAGVAFTIGAYSVYIVNCSPAALAAAGGSSRAGRGRRAGKKGLDPAAIAAIPMLVYSDVKGLRLGKGALECAICLCEFNDDETLRWMPKCDHVFHPDCIDEWLTLRSTCPVCRAELSLQPGESAIPVAPPVGTFRAEETSIQVAAEESRDGDVERGREEPEPDLVLANTNNTQQSQRCEPRFFKARRLMRSHSTGHSLVQPGQDTERFTLRLPIEVRKQVIDRAAILAESSRRGHRAGCGEGSSRGRYLRWPQVLDRAFKSDRWVFARIPSFFMRSSPAISPRVPGLVEGGSLGRSTRTAKEARPPV